MTHEERTIQAIATALPSVCSIIIGKDASAVEKEIPQGVWDEIKSRTKTEKHPPSHEEIMSHMPHLEDGKIRVGNGSGFIVSKEGYVLTNKHVVVDADATYTVITASNDKYEGKVIARDPLNDVAILKIDIDMPRTSDLADSDTVQLGQSVIALGNALGEFANSASAGIVSGLARFLTAIADDAGKSEQLRGLIQTDAAINPGNSGGPLINLDGKVVGINAAVVFGAENIGFAIPINRARRDLADLVQFGHIRRPFLGIRYMAIDQGVKKRMNLLSDHGLLVKGEKIPGYPAVLPHSPADKAGLQELDILHEVNDVPISAGYAIEDVLEKANIGDVLRLSGMRKNEKKNWTVTLEERK